MNPPHTAATWPIAAAMINVPNIRPDGSSVQADSPDAWLASVSAVRAAGFDHIDPTDSWLRVADLDADRRREFGQVIAEAGLGIVSLSTARRSVIDPEHADSNLAYSHRVIDAAAELGADVVSFGLMRSLTRAQSDALWFWTAQGPVDPNDSDVWNLAVRRFKELGDHADAVGVDISLEMYEDTYLGSPESAVRFVTDIDHQRVGLNPDLGNLVRLHRPVPHWKDMVHAVLPFANYWHVKNYSRIEDATTGAVFTIPAAMELGTIDYRYAVAFAIESGFRGAFCTEHYGGDGLSVSATNRDYLRRVLSATIPHEAATQEETTP